MAGLLTFSLLSTTCYAKSPSRMILASSIDQKVTTLLHHRVRYSHARKIRTGLADGIRGMNCIIWHLNDKTHIPLEAHKVQSQLRVTIKIKKTGPVEV